MKVEAGKICMNFLNEILSERSQSWFRYANKSDGNWNICQWVCSLSRPITYSLTFSSTLKWDLFHSVLLFSSKTECVMLFHMSWHDINFTGTLQLVGSIWYMLYLVGVPLKFVPWTSRAKNNNPIFTPLTKLQKVWALIILLFVSASVAKTQFTSVVQHQIISLIGLVAKQKRRGSVAFIRV